MRRLDLIAVLGGAMASVAAAVPFSAAQIIIFQPLPLKQLLEENGWVSLPLPDKRMGPGSVIKVTKKDRCRHHAMAWRFAQMRDHRPGVSICAWKVSCNWTWRELRN